MDYALIWAGLLAFAVLAYVVLDGFDLGVGLLFPFLKSERHKDTAMNSVAPMWDGNETWLVLGGGGLFAVFPLAYAVLLPALYAPIIAMLLGLVLRGVAFEFRWRTRRGKFIWDISFFGGSLIASLAQGITLGALVQGIQVADRAYTGGWWDWLTPFTLLTGIALVVGYALLGATWLVMKTEDELQKKAYRYAWFTGLCTFALIGLVSIWTPLLHPEYWSRWFSMPALLFTLPVPLLLLISGLWLFKGLYQHRHRRPFIAALLLFVLCFTGIIISFYPNIVPPSISIWDAAAPDSSLKFLLVGAAVLIPIIVAYTAYAYWVFRGKVDTDGFYH